MESYDFNVKMLKSMFTYTPVPSSYSLLLSISMSRTCYQIESVQNNKDMKI